MERLSEHPLAGALLAAAAERRVALENVANFSSVTGKGVIGSIGGRRVAVGNAALLSDDGIADAALGSRAEELRQDGATVLFVAVDGRLAGIIAVADPVKGTTLGALDALRSEGLRIVMLTGDHATTAQAVARKLGITEVEADVLPDQKSAVIRRLKREGHVVAMAGDGVNDAPALAAADVGIAMGTGTDIAMQSAGLTLVKGDLAGIARARALSRATMRNIRQNLVLAFVYNAVGIPGGRGRAVSRLRAAVEPDDRRGRHELELGVGDRQRASLAGGADLSSPGATPGTAPRSSSGSRTACRSAHNADSGRASTACS